ncbi:unnamed protein product, partial [Polarella glacialis]
SRYAALQRAFNDRLREWQWQRNEGTSYQVWQPPGVIFSCLKKDHHSHGRSLPPWSEWGFVENDIPRRLVLGALGGRWAIWQAGHRQQERWFVADGDDSRVFNSFIRAMNFYG